MDTVNGREQRRRPNKHACKPSTTAPPASWPESTRPQQQENPDETQQAADRGQRGEDQDGHDPAAERRHPARREMRHQDPRYRGGVDRTAFYGSRPYAHLRAEFEQRLKGLHDAGEQPDPRDAQVTRLKNAIAQLKERLTQSDATISELAGFRDQALARIAAQHDEITRLRQETRSAARIRRFPAPAPSPKEQQS